MTARALHRAALLLAACVIVAGSPGCASSPNKLEGSLGDVYDLDFATVDAQLVGSFLVVQYVRAASGGKTIKMSVDLTGFTVSPGAAISLVEKGATGGPRGTLQRIVEATTDLPLATGSLTLDAVPAPGMHLGGSFGATFSMPAGRALRGEFGVDRVGKL